MDDKKCGSFSFSVLEKMKEESEAFGWDPEKISESLKEEMKTFDRKVVVLDDDPTGIQTVHDIPVYTDWKKDSMKAAMEEEGRMYFVLTNSRSFSAEKTTEAHREAAGNIVEAAKAAGKEILLISRGDSTLRGHYPLETRILRETLEEKGHEPFCGEVLMPFFAEGGRYTIDGVHYVKEGESLIPAGQTEFAKDRTFGYSASSLDEYIEEKSGGAVKACDVIGITWKELRFEEPDVIVRRLEEAEGFRYVTVDAVCEADVKAFARVLLRLMKAGKHYLIRSAAAVPKVFGGVEDRPLLTKEELIAHDALPGGMVLVGSHVKKTTDQLNELLRADRPMKPIEFCVSSCIEEGGAEREAQRAAEEAEAAMKEGKTAVVYTSRTLMTPENATKEELLALSVRISDAVTSVVARLTKKPAFLIAKGGITSSDVGTRALAVKKALVLGQVQPGIPVWRTGSESRFPGISYIIFPGNVGDAGTLRKIVEELTR